MTELRASGKGLWGRLRETWYGEAEPCRKGTRLIVKIGPLFPKENIPEGTCLEFNLPGVVFGPMVLATERYVRLPKGFWDMTLTTRPEIPISPPECIVDISFDPTPDGMGAWRQRVTGRWAVRLTRVRRKSLWNRLR